MRKIIELVIIWISIVIIVVNGINEKKINYKRKKIFLFVFILLTSLLLGHNSVLLDTPGYIENYNNFSQNQLLYFLSKNPFENQLEWIYLLMVFLAKKLHLSFGMFLSLYIFIPQYLIFIKFLKDRENVITKYSIYYMFICFFPMGYRQMFSDSFYLLTFLSSNFIVGIIFYLISIFSHFSNLCISVFPIIKNNVIFKVSTVQMFFIIIITSIMMRQIVVSFVNILPANNSIVFKLQYYMIYSSVIYNYQNLLHYLLHFLVYNFLPISIIILLIAKRNFLKCIDKAAYNSVLLSVYMYLVIYLVFNSYVTASRIFLTFLLPIVLLVKNNSIQKNVYIIFLLNDIIISLYIIFTYLGWG